MYNKLMYEYSELCTICMIILVYFSNASTSTYISVELRVAMGATQIPLKIKKKSLMSKRKDIDKKFSASYSSTALQIKLVTRMISSVLF